ncbi:MAG: hypothetical protein IT436_09135 [Phycisphaerales bacterium]|nr:hypothetical protein [Phycisphaerales bacterium]
MGKLMSLPSASNPAESPSLGPVAVWAEPGQVDLVRSVAQLAAVTITAAGAPSRGQTGAVAKELGCAGHDDLRSLIATTEARAVLIFAPGDFGLGRDGSDLEAIQSAAARGVRVASLEPIPATLFGQGESSPGPAIHPMVTFMPRLRTARPFREAGEILSQIGPPRTLSVEAWNAAGAGSLGAAMYGAMDLLSWLMGEPRQIDAVLLPAGGSPGRGPESLRDLHGDLTAVIRFDDARAATMVLSDQGGRWSRAATLTSPQGRFRVFDDGFEWIGPDGRKLDELRLNEARRGELNDPRHAQRAIAQAVKDLLSPSPAEAPESTADGVMVLCETALLSARTSQAESPESIRRMLEVV